MDSNESFAADYYEGAGNYDRETVRFFDVAHEGAQVRAIGAAAGALGQLRGFNPRSIVVIATDHISRAAAEAAATMRAPLPLPVVVTRTLPDYVGPLDVVVVVGDCTEDFRTGDDTRCLSTATRRGAVGIVAGPHRAPIVEDAPDSVTVIPALPSTAKASPLRSFALVWAVLDSLTQPSEMIAEYLYALADEVDVELQALSPQREETVNAARQLRAFSAHGRVLHVGISRCGEAVAKLASHIWSARGIPSGLTGAAELPEATAQSAETSIFHDPFIDGDDSGELVALKTIMWAEPKSSLPRSRAEYTEPTSLGEAASAARLIVRAYATTAMDV
ncbi:hypothetical protein [Corynebacterium mayonis]|uniref:hypothetical protein n=1 Tax=Corynebacterium mayonis TaxID=3062461 RepID=UPI00313FFDAF